MSKYFISLFILFSSIYTFSQVNKPIDLNAKDSVEYKQKYGLRIGVDLSRPILSLIDEDYTGLEFVADYRLKEKLFIAAELGNEERTITEGVGSTSLFNFTSSGSYLKLGADYNTYKNWYGEQNFITIGGRYAFSSFTQTLNSFRVFDSNDFFIDEFPDLVTSTEEFSGLTTSWLELVLGLKAELFKNIYASITVRLGYIITGRNGNPRFPNLWVPGFNKLTDGSNFGVGYNYSISYFIPLYKKPKKKREEALQKSAQ